MHIGSQKNIMSKNVFEQEFGIGKGDNPKLFNFGFWQICQLYNQIFGPLISFSYYLVLVVCKF